MSFRSENPSSLLFEVRKNDNGNQNQERNKHTNINDNKSNNHQEPTTYNNHHDTSYNHLQTLACNPIQHTALEHSPGAHENVGTELDCLPNDGPGSLQHRAAKSLPHFPVWTPGISFQGTKLCKIHQKKTRLLERRLVNVLEGDAFTTQKVAIILWTQRSKGAKVSFCYSKGQHHLTWVLMCLGTKTISAGFTPVLQSLQRTNWTTLQSLQIPKKLWLLGAFPSLLQNHAESKWRFHLSFLATASKQKLSSTPNVRRGSRVSRDPEHLNDQTTTLHESRAWEAYLIWVILSCKRCDPSEVKCQIPKISHQKISLNHWTI